MVETLPEDIIRAKGVLYLQEDPNQRFVFQLVGRRWSLKPGGEWGAARPGSRLVMIGLPGSIDANWLERTVIPCDKTRKQYGGKTMIYEVESLLHEFVAYVRESEDREDILSLYLVVDPADERNQGPSQGMTVQHSRGMEPIGDIDEQFIDALLSRKLGLAEVVITPRSEYIGQTVKRERSQCQI